MGACPSRGTTFAVWIGSGESERCAARPAKSLVKQAVKGFKAINEGPVTRHARRGRRFKRYPNPETRSRRGARRGPAHMPRVKIGPAMPDRNTLAVEKWKATTVLISIACAIVEFVCFAGAYWPLGGLREEPENSS